MIFPDAKDITVDNFEEAVKVLYRQSKKTDDLRKCDTLHNWLWKLEPEFYPQDHPFCMDPVKEARKRREIRRPGAENYDPIFYYLLPLVDVSANHEEGKDDPLAACVDMKTVESSARALLSAYVRLSKPKVAKLEQGFEEPEKPAEPVYSWGEIGQATQGLAEKILDYTTQAPASVAFTHNESLLHEWWAEKLKFHMSMESSLSGMEPTGEHGEETRRELTRNLKAFVSIFNTIELFDAQLLEQDWEDHYLIVNTTTTNSKLTETEAEKKKIKL